MSEPCKDIDAALRQLNNAINQQNQRIRDLEKQLGGGNNNKNNDLSARVSRLESYCESIEKLFQELQQVIEPIVKIFKG